MKQQITVIKNQDNGASYFTEKEFSLEDKGGMWISEQQSALNFRHRKSEAGYRADWHVAGDPTLIIILQGTLRIGLRNGEYRDFTKGMQFIAADSLKSGEIFNNLVHGHNAEVIDGQDLVAVHIKLSKQLN